jgi:Zn-dependent peptidase ImmA (M78 family)
MISVDDDKLFKQYYQGTYDFNTSSLNSWEINEIKTLVKEKRVNYALAPIGEKIFNYIMEQNPNIYFELVELDTETIDGMLYIPKNGDDKAYIILNTNKPFINQIFAAAHEYYHYIKDYEITKKQPFICSLSSLNSKSEKKASRFAAELLLPEETLRNEIRLFKSQNDWNDKKKISFEEYAVISMILTIKYQLPLKATIYRLHEEGYIDHIDEFIENYDVIKRVLMQIELLKNEIELLYGNTNRKLDNGNIIYRQIEAVYKHGLASREEIIKDADKLSLNKDIILKFFENAFRQIFSYILIEVYFPILRKLHNTCPR